jgi:alkylation response protein AidB-like acyl-CoA dehydrogenase
MPLPTEEQEMLRDMAHNWAQKDMPVNAFRAVRDNGTDVCFDPDAYRAIADMGWAGAVVPESYGGSEVGYASLGVVLEELGRTLVAAPLLGSAVGAVSALTLGGSDAQKSDWLPRIASGEAIGALAVDESHRFSPESIELSAVSSDGGFTLTGHKRLVHEGMAADMFVVAARTSGGARDSAGVTLFLVPADAGGLSREQRRLLDSRGYADITFTDVAVGNEGVIGEVGGGRELLDKVLDRVTVCAASEAFGLSVQAFETTLEYLKTRVQFGQIIGTFQALQHRAAKLFTEIQLARPCLEEAFAAIDADSPDAPALVSLAKATVNDLVHLMSREMIQLHGGIGMTDAYDAGFYIKRARVLEAAFGTTGYHRERYARLNGM